MILMKIFEASKKTLTTSEKKEITSIYEELKKISSDDKIKEAVSLVKAKVTRLERSDDIHQIALVTITKVLINEVLEKSESGFYMRRLALISIAYLCDPYDVIPDSDPEYGYLDDIYVFYLALSEIRRMNPDIYERIEIAYARLNEDE